MMRLNFPSLSFVTRFSSPYEIEHQRMVRMTSAAFHGVNSGVQIGTNNAPINNTQVYLALGIQGCQI